MFGEDNIVSIICVELSKTQGMKVKSAQDGRIVKNHEYIYLYCKNIEQAFNDRMPLYDKTDIWDSHFNKIIIKEVLNVTVGGKKFSKSDKFDSEKYFGKDIFSKYIFKNYNEIDFSNFLKILDSIDSLI